MDKKIIICLIAMIYLIGFVSAGETVSMSDVTVCCEKTNSGLYCQDVREEDCSPDANALPTACASTSFCKPGFCFDSVEGTCLDNVPQMVCNNEDGTWKSEMPAQCELGCCVLGDQASFVTLTRCKRLSSMFGLETNYNKNLKDELQCVMSARADEKGACVYVANPADAQPTCKFVTRSECESESSTSAGEEIKEKESSENESVLEEALGGEEKYGGTLLSPSDAEFHAGLLCSAEELGTDCGMTKETICLAGHEEVYFADTCGNPANIYDASKVNDKRYWSEIIDKAESCNPDASNGGSQTCGNCNYILGAVCRESSSTTGRATYGDNVCADLGCEDGKGEEQMHGESWCVSPGADKVGSKYYRHSCVNNEVLSEPCAEFRNEICIENSISTSEGDFTQAACRVNRWQDCTSIFKKLDCENSDRRDCIWMDGIEYTLMGGIIFVILMSPLLIFDLRHNFMNFNNIKIFFTQRETTVSVKPWKSLPNIYPIFRDSVVHRLVAAQNILAGKISINIIVFAVVTYMVLMLTKLKRILFTSDEKLYFDKGALLLIVSTTSWMTEKISLYGALKNSLLSVTRKDANLL